MRDRRGFNPFQGICPSAARGETGDRIGIGNVSIPSRESVLLRPQTIGTGDEVTGVFQSLPGNLSFCGRGRIGLTENSPSGVSIPSRESVLLRLVVSPALQFQANNFQYASISADGV
jgi:hypothetical protein